MHITFLLAVAGLNSNETKAEYPAASIIGDNRIVFNIKGNRYRLIAKINFDYKMVLFRSDKLLGFAENNIV